MNHYYATGAVIFENPPSNSPNPKYGSIGHLESHLRKYQIKVEYSINKINKAGIDMTLTAPNGKTFFIDYNTHEESRKEVYKWTVENGKLKEENIEI